MARQPRIHLDGYPLHIVQRGHNGQRCVFNDDDYARYRDWLFDGVDKAGCELHAYVLMTNHVHVLLTPRKAAAVPEVFISLGRRYVQYVNRIYQRRGTLWEGRYRSSLIATDNYLLACYRYIETNPVRAGLVNDPGAYRWSSYRTNALGRREPGIVPHVLYVKLGATDDARRAAYRALFEWPATQKSIDEIRRSIQRSEPVGNARKAPSMLVAQA